MQFDFSVNCPHSPPAQSRSRAADLGELIYEILNNHSSHSFSEPSEMFFIFFGWTKLPQQQPSAATHPTDSQAGLLKHWNPFPLPTFDFTVCLMKNPPGAGFGRFYGSLSNTTLYCCSYILCGAAFRLTWNLVQDSWKRCPVFSSASSWMGLNLWPCTPCPHSVQASYKSIKGHRIKGKRQLEEWMKW